VGGGLRGSAGILSLSFRFRMNSPVLKFCLKKRKKCKKYQDKDSAL
jgi:hypothetical protein